MFLFTLWSINTFCDRQVLHYVQCLILEVRLKHGVYHFRSVHAAASTDAMSTAIDGADQAQYGLPYFAQDDKSMTNSLKYKVSELCAERRKNILTLGAPMCLVCW